MWKKNLSSNKQYNELIQKKGKFDKENKLGSKNNRKKTSRG